MRSLQSIEAAKPMETKMANNVREMSRVRFTEKSDPDYRAGFWLVEILSPISGWIVQGVHSTRAGAESDRENWL